MAEQLPRSVKSIIEQLRKRGELLDRFCVVSNAKVYKEIADLIESGAVFYPRFGEEL